MNYFKSPLCYCGNKYKLLTDIVPLFPKDIDTFVDLFCGGLDVSVNVNAKQTISNDIMFPLIDLYEYLKNKENDEIYSHIKNLIDKSYCTDKESYNELRDLYNQNRHPLDLLFLVFCSFSSLVMFNSKKEFNTTFGRPISSEKISKIIPFANKIREKDITFSKKSFIDVDMSLLKKGDFVYCDPPYLISCGTYQDGKRGFNGWNEDYEHKLYDILKKLNERQVSFAVSNVLYHKGMHNDILQSFIDDNSLIVHHLKMNYNHVNGKYHKDKKTDEVLVCNYKSETQYRQLTLF